MMKQLISMIFIFFVLSNCVLQAQSQRFSFGIFGDYSQNSNVANFKELQGIPMPPAAENFRSGLHSGFNAGVLVNFPFALLFDTASFLSHFQLGVRGIYWSHNAVLSSDEPTTLIVNTTPTPATIHHSIDAPLASFGAEPMFSISPFDGFQLHFGLHFATLNSPKFTKTQEISDKKFINNSTTWNPISGDIIGTSSENGTVIGISYNYALNPKKTLWIAPELFYYSPTTDVASGLSWKISSIRAGISFAYSPYVRPTLRDTTFIRDTTSQIIAGIERETIVLADAKEKITRLENEEWIRLSYLIEQKFVRQIPKDKPKEKPKEIAVQEKPSQSEIPKVEILIQKPQPPKFSVSVAAIFRDNSTRPIDSLEVEESVENKHAPLLSYIFFDENSEEIPVRYSKLSAVDTNKFSLQMLKKTETIGIYHQILNVIGKRLQENSQANITITGCNNNQNIEKNNHKLSSARAESVRKYLSSVWNISDDRMKIQIRNLPKKPSNNAEKEGMEENRRVEISSDDAAILSPVFISDTTHTTKVRKLEFLPVMETTTPIREWHFSLVEADAAIYTLKGMGTIPKKFDVILDSADLAKILRKRAFYSMQCTDTAGQTGSLSPTILSVKIYSDKNPANKYHTTETNRYALLLFEFNSGLLSSEHRELIDLIRQKIDANSYITILGTTDATGNEEHNRNLSLQRAKAVARALGISADAVEGMGEDASTFPNSMPEGRFYSRTVIVVLEKK